MSSWRLASRAVYGAESGTQAPLPSPFTDHRRESLRVHLVYAIQRLKWTIFACRALQDGDFYDLCVCVIVRRLM